MSGGEVVLLYHPRDTVVQKNNIKCFNNDNILILSYECKEMQVFL